MQSRGACVKGEKRRECGLRAAHTWSCQTCGILNVYQTRTRVIIW